ncbi:DUF648 domain-containing protein [Parachlamydia sp. AcF125]|uniref:DUF648 domain-containing protein n=1 Tax=Parachlamydia sp. AcF125 TaxID=2795736 RepID=UPI001BC8D19A|nr:DUF648 domain-containing protein [Parachlamydia sp. AcF125]MBS4168143.1 hypothetical protein [Parachlamydia sp. AcF125]
MEKISFFTAIKTPNTPKSAGLYLLEKVDSYFYLGGKKATVISARGKNLELSLVNEKVSSFAIALKVASYCTLLLPALMLAAKVLLRYKYRFCLHVKLPETPSATKLKPITLEERKIAAVAKIQNAYRKYKLAKERHSLFLHFLDGRKQAFSIFNEESLRNFLKIIAEHFHLHPHSLKITLNNLSTSQDELKKIFQLLENAANFEPLLFKLSKWVKGQIIVKPKPVSAEALPDGKARFLYGNGIVEEFILDCTAYQGCRYFPDGKREVGKFDEETGELRAGYRMQNHEVLELIKINHTLNVTFPDNSVLKINISKLDDLNACLDKIVENFQFNHQAVKAEFSSAEDNGKFEEIFQYVAHAHQLTCLIFHSSSFRLSTYFRGSILLKPLKIEELANGKIRKIYPNGTIETFIRVGEQYKGTRIYADGKREKGFFDLQSGQHVFGFKVERDGHIELVNMVYKLSVVFSKCPLKDFHISNSSHIGTFLGTIAEQITSTPPSIIVEFDTIAAYSSYSRRFVNIYNESQLEICIESFKRLTSDRFDICRYGDSRLAVQPKPLKTENLAESKIRRVYANGVIEEFSLAEKEDCGLRSFPEGKTEEGTFHKKTGMLLAGCRMDKGGIKEEGTFDERTGQLTAGAKSQNGEFYYINPSSLLYYFQSKGPNFKICIIENQLAVLESTPTEKDTYTKSKLPIESVLLKLSERPKSSASPLYLQNKGLLPVLAHPSFQEKLKPFIAYVVASNEEGVPRLFNFSDLAAKDILKIAAKIKEIDFDPQKLIHPSSGKNFILQAAYWGNLPLLETLIQLFPQSFLACGQDAIAEMLKKRRRDAMFAVAEKYEKLGGTLDMFHQLWLAVASQKKPTPEFREDFRSLTPSQQRFLYDVAFKYENPFIHEPPDTPMAPEQFSVNLMWINKSKMSDEQEFLLGKGSSPEERLLDFQNSFVKPIAKWATKNPNSTIHIWIDSEMATPKAIENSRQMLLNKLKDVAHGQICFRDVRSLELVQTYPEVFSEKFPVYFRVDLLRAIAADHVLRAKETKFFVYGDLDMKALSSQELFDKKTVEFLNDYGFVMSKNSRGYENGFQILNGENKQFMASHRHVIIDLTIDMALKKPKKIKEQQIYDTYKIMLAHFLHEDGRYGKADIESLAEGKNPAKFFRRDRFGSSSIWLVGDKTIDLPKLLPTKPVRIPTSHFFWSSITDESLE